MSTCRTAGESAVYPPTHQAFDGWHPSPQLTINRIVASPCPLPRENLQVRTLEKYQFYVTNPATPGLKYNTGLHTVTYSLSYLTSAPTSLEPYSTPTTYPCDCSLTTGSWPVARPPPALVLVGNPLDADQRENQGYSTPNYCLAGISLKFLSDLYSSLGVFSSYLFL